MSRQALKAAREAIQHKQYSAALDKACEVLESDEANYHALVFAGLAQLNLGHHSESKSYYEKARDTDPGQQLAWQGLQNLYTVTKDLEPLYQVTVHLAQSYQESGNREKCVDTVQAFINLSSSCGDEDMYYKGLKLCLPNSSIFESVEGRVLPPEYIFKQLADGLGEKEAAWIAKQLASSRSRLGVDMKKLAAELKVKVYKQSQYLEYVQGFIDWTADDEIRREYELRYFQRLYDMLLCYHTDEKPALRDKVHKLVCDFVLLKFRNQQVWDVFLEWTDVSLTRDYETPTLVDYVQFFPDSALASCILAMIPAVSKAKQSGDDQEDIADDAIPDRNQLAADILDLANANQSSILCQRAACELLCELEEYQILCDRAADSLKLLDRLRLDTSVEMPHTLLRFQTWLATGYLNNTPPKFFPQAETLFKKILHKYPLNIESLVGTAVLAELRGNYEHALSVLRQAHEVDSANYSVAFEMAWSLYKLAKFEESTALLRSHLELYEGKMTDLEVSDSFLLLGLCLEETDGLSNAHALYVQALRKNPNNASVYARLGFYYQEYTGDGARAIKCFQKAFELDSAQLDAGEKLAQMFAESKDSEMVQVIAERAASSTTRDRFVQGTKCWPHRAMGVLAATKLDWPSAIRQFQTALRSRPTDAQSWSGLGEAYYRAGRPIAALKALERAAQYESESWYSQYLRACIYRDVKNFEASIATSLALLKDKPNEASVYLILCDSYRLASAWQLREGRVREAFKNAELALKYCISLIKFDDTCADSWKIIGDVCLKYLQAPNMLQQFPLADLDGLLPLLKDSDPVLDEISKIENELKDSGSLDDTICSIAIQVYAQQLRFSVSSKSAGAASWYNLGVCLLYIGRYKNGNSSLYDSSALCLREAIRLNPTFSKYWNAYGVLMSSTNARVSQHSFIKALKFNSKDAVIWTNLGLLYLLQHDLEIALECFIKAQTIDPDNARAWLGQSISAKLTDEILEAFDLASNALALSGPSVGEIIMQFAQLQLNLQREGKIVMNKAEISATIYYLQSMLYRDNNDRTALYTIALYLERCGEYARAQEFAMRLSELLEQDYEISESTESLMRFIKTKCLLSRLFLAQNEASEAYEAAEMGLALLDNVQDATDFKDYFVLLSALSAFSMGDFETAETNLEECLGNEKFGSDATVMLSQAMWSTGSLDKQVLAEDSLRNMLKNGKAAPNAVTAILAMDFIRDREQNIAKDLEFISRIDFSRHENAQVARLGRLISLVLNHKPSMALRAGLQRLLFVKPDLPKLWEAASSADGGSGLWQITRDMYAKDTECRVEDLSIAMAQNKSDTVSYQRAVFICPWKYNE